jgi:hypothetical protein
MRLIQGWVIRTVRSRRLIVVSVAVVALLATGLTFAQSRSLPAADERWDQLISVTTSPRGEPLPSLLQGLASSVGLTALVQGVPDTPFPLVMEAKPFRQVWDLVIRLNNLEFVLLPNNIVVVGPGAIINLVAPPPPPEPVAVEPDEPLPVTPDPIIRQFYTIRTDPQAITSFLRSEVPGIQVTPVPGLNLLTIRGTQRQQDEVATLLDRVDRRVEEVPREQRTFKLSNATASRVAPLLMEALGAVTTDAARIGPSIVADDRTNSLIVTGTGGELAQVAALIPDLDVKVPQVNVQVRIAEVSTGGLLRLGINLNPIQVGFGGLTGSILSGALNFAFDTTAAPTTFNLGGAINALQQVNLARTIDDTNVSVLNNQTARIQAGNTLIFVVTAATGEQSLQTVDVGTIVEVTPQITADGDIALVIRPEVSTVAGFDAAGRPNNISKRTAETQLRIRDGQTIVLGGLLQDRIINDEFGVPILSSIPLIGELFKTRELRDSQIELLIIITANIIR